MSDEQTALFAGVLAAPDDPLPKLVLADWLDEHDKPYIAWAFRWCAKNGKHPRISPTGRAVVWERESVLTRKKMPHLLPALMFDLFRPTGRRPFRCRSAWEAFLYLADAIQRVDELTRVK